MDSKIPPRDALDLLSREFGLEAGANGVVAWADARSRRLLGLEEGRQLLHLATPGTEAKLAALLERGAEGRVEGWEVPLQIGGKPVTVSFCAHPAGGRVLMVGHVIPEHFSNALEQLSESMEEVVSLNRQVVGQKREIERRHEELVRLNRELSESHQGVLTMHSELEDRAAELRHIAETKTRIVSNVSHEFRTPLHSILGLTRLLAEGADGELNEAQAKQLGFIRASAEELVELVDDLLDLSKAEAGKAVLRTERFDLAELFASLRGMMRPLVPEGAAVELAFEEPPASLALETDKAKVSHVLRNLVSNALKFTERGEVRVAARAAGDGMLAISVTDTGIGIPEANLESIFEEFGQVDSPVQARVKGTGLGLPLARRLAHLLGGSLAVESRPGAGSRFTFSFPVVHAEVRETTRC